MPDGPQETPFGQPLRAPPEKEPYKILPVLFVLGTIGTLYTIYVFAHLMPMLQLTEPPNMVDIDLRFRGLVECCIFHGITLLLLLSYIRCVLVHPGEVPHAEPWLYTASGPRSKPAFQELKKSGERRHCKWCGKYKPDRCHHCRVCNSCVLKMDHHCPWIYNCVGFHNYKYFFLLLFYTVLATHFIVWTMTESMVRAVDENASFLVMFFLLFGLTLAFFLGALLTLFFCFHCWITTVGLTTIEFCESRFPKKSVEGEGRGGGGGGCFDCLQNDSPFNLGPCGNLCATLGDNPLTWLLPISGPSGDGLVYEVADQGPSLHRGLEVERGRRQKVGGAGGGGGSCAGSRRKLFEAPPQQGYGAATLAWHGLGGSIFEPAKPLPDERALWQQRRGWQ